jgi:hypothetical protein
MASYTFFTVLNSAGATTYFGAVENGTGLFNQSIPTNLSGTALIGSSVMANAIPFTLATDQPAMPVNLASVGGVSFGLGQAVMATSLPVAIASNQSAIPVTIGSGTSPIGTATVLQGTNPWVVNLSQINGTAISIGQGVMTASVPVVIASNQSNLTTVLGAALPAGTNAIGTVSITGALPAGTNALGTVSITGALPAGTNAIGTATVLQGTAQWAVNLEQVGGSTLAFGQAVMASSIPVAIASNQSAIPVTGSLSASISGFQPGNSYTSQTFSTAAGTIGLPTGTTVIVYNVGSNSVSVALGTTTISAATTNDQIQAGGWLAYAVGTATTLGGITANSTTKLVLSGGQGLPTGVGGLSSGGSGGSVTQGTVPWLDNISQFGGSTVALGQGVMASSMPVVIASNQSNLTTVLGAAIPAGTNAIGTVSVTGALPAGTNAIGTATVLQGTAQWAVNLDQVGGSTLAFGQAVMATSIPVAIASNQSAIPVTIGAGTNVIGTATVLQGTNPWVVNLSQINGTAISIGQAVMATSLPVAIASNQSAIPVTIGAGANAIGTVSVTGALPAGTNAIGTATVLQGTAEWASNVNQIGGVALAFGQAVMATSIPVAIASNQSTLPINLGTVAGVAIATSGFSGGLAVGGLTAAGGAPVGYPLWLGAQAQTGEIATSATGKLIPLVADKVGKQIILPHANPENYTSGKAAINTTVAQQIITAANATNRFYMTSMQLGNSSTAATTILVSLNDPAQSQFIVPGGGGSNLTFPVPLVFGLGSAVLATCAAAAATVYVNAQGYVGT